jgi:DNA mismatch endonuclease (patch repair protein)
LSSEWLAKITRNIERDRRVDRDLQDNGWTVIRMWETDISADIRHCVDTVRAAINRRAIAL